MNLEFTAVHSKVHCSEADSEDTDGHLLLLRQTLSCPTLEWNTHRITEGELGQALLLKRKSRREYDGSVVDCRPFRQRNTAGNRTRKRELEQQVPPFPP
ncbi:unnamed protein product [Boreogadus saida]